MIGKKPRRIEVKLTQFDLTDAQLETKLSKAGIPVDTIENGAIFVSRGTLRTFYGVYSTTYIWTDKE